MCVGVCVYIYNIVTKGKAIKFGAVKRGHACKLKDGIVTVYIYIYI